MPSDLVNAEGEWLEGVFQSPRRVAPCRARADRLLGRCVNCRLPCPVLYFDHDDDRSLDDAPCIRHGVICEVCLSPCPYVDGTADRLET